MVGYENMLYYITADYEAKFPLNAVKLSLYLFSLWKSENKRPLNVLEFV